MLNKNELIRKFIQLGCFKEGNFLLKSGKQSNYYVDLRCLVSHPSILKQICELIYDCLDIGTDLWNICGLPYAGIPYAQTLSIMYDVPNILLRKEKKNHGTLKMIEGEFQEGDELVIIDDILTSGASLIESLEHLKQFNIKKIIVIVDRKEGGMEKLKEIGYNIESLFTIDDFKKEMSSVNIVNTIRKNIIQKKSNICVSLDYTTTSKILETIELLKYNIVMVKLHCDIIEDFNSQFVDDLVKLCRTNNILIIEDRKFGDIGNTFKHQFTGGIYKIREWADFITFHGIVGEGQIAEFDKLRKSGQFALLVSQMSNNKNLLDYTYTKKVLDIGKDYDNTVLGYICQNIFFRDRNHNKFIYFTPGVKLDEGNDSSDQKYITPRRAILNGSDIIIVGRGIINSDNVLETCKIYQREAWETYEIEKDIEST